MKKVPGGVLAAKLESVVEYAKEHVRTCWLCNQKGFICEVCANPKPIFPFDNTYKVRQKAALIMKVVANNLILVRRLLCCFSRWLSGLKTTLSKVRKKKIKIGSRVSCAFIFFDWGRLGLF